MTDTAETRSDRSRAAILTAAYELYQELPYAQMTIEAIAARAGVGKPTIYRRWPSKGPVILAAVIEHLRPPGFPDTGNFRADVRAWLYGIADWLADPVDGHPFLGLAGAAQHDPELAHSWQEDLYKPIRTANATRLRAAQAAGDVPPGDVSLMADALAGAIWFRILVTGRTTSHAEVDALVDLVLPAPAADR